MGGADGAPRQRRALERIYNAEQLSLQSQWFYVLRANDVYEVEMRAAELLTLGPNL